jgi:hypothetical protein
MCVCVVYTHTYFLTRQAGDLLHAVDCDIVHTLSAEEVVELY